MSRSKLRKEYEAVFGVVDGTLKLYDADGNKIYYEDSSGWWAKYEYDADGNEIYYGNCRDYWAKYEFEANGNVIYWEDSNHGVICDKRPCSNKVFIEEQTGKKFKLTEVEINE